MLSHSTSMVKSSGILPFPKTWIWFSLDWEIVYLNQTTVLAWLAHQRQSLTAVGGSLRRYLCHLQKWQWNFKNIRSIDNVIYV